MAFAIHKLYHLNCWWHSVVYTKSCSKLVIFVFLFNRKIKYSPAFAVPFCPTQPPAHPLNLIYILPIPGCCCKWTCPTQAPNIPCTHFHIHFHCLGRTKRSAQARRTCTRFVTRPVFTVRICQHLVQTPRRRITPCRLFPTAYSIYHSYPPYWVSRVAQSV